MEKELSIIVFTHRRPDFLLRFLKYYNCSALKYQLIVGDGGKDTLPNEIHNEIKKNKNIIYKKFNNEFDFKRKQYKIQKFFHRRRSCLSLVNTKYVKFICDDDFIINHSTEKCLKFLNKNKKYIAAGGSYMDYSLNKKYYGKFLYLKNTYQTTTKNSNNKTKRLIEYFRNQNDTFHYIFRTKDLIKIHKISSRFKSDNMDFNYHNFECIVHLYGKTKFFSDPIIFHEAHNDWHEGTEGDMIERLKDISFIKNLDLFTQQISNYFKIKNKKLIKNLYYQHCVSKQLNNLNNKNYHGIIDIIKYLINVLKIKYKLLKKFFFYEKINIKKHFKFNSEIINEIIRYKKFLQKEH